MSNRPQQANASKLYHISRADLPLHCPMPNMAVWDSHPRVYLPMGQDGRARCPYCGAVYELKE